MNDLQQPGSLGFQLPSPWYIFGSIVFSLIGFGVYRYGRQQDATVSKWIGIVLMLYPYAVEQTWLLYVCGVGLCVAAYYYRK